MELQLQVRLRLEMLHKDKLIFALGLGPCDRASRAKCDERVNQQDATIRCLLSTSVLTCFGHHYAHLQEIKDRVTAYGVLRWYCWMWLVAVVGCCVVGCEHKRI
jgi:hypothetical protein